MKAPSAAVEQTALAEDPDQHRLFQAGALGGSVAMAIIDERHKPNHNSFALYYHLVFVTLKREPFINAEMAVFLRGFFAAKCIELGMHLLEQGILSDHVHLLVSLRPSHYIPEVVNFLKGTASHEANHHHEFEIPLYWMRGYRVDTVSAVSLDRAATYVRTQLNHHPDKVPAGSPLP